MLEALLPHQSVVTSAVHALQKGSVATFLMDALPGLRALVDTGRTEGSRWIDAATTGHVNLARVQARYLIDLLRRPRHEAGERIHGANRVEKIVDVSRTWRSANTEEAFALFEAFKAIIDEPDFDTIYGHRADPDEAAHRAVHRFAWEVLSDPGYEAFAPRWGLPSSYLEIPEGQTRKGALHLYEANLVRQFKDDGYTVLQIANDLGLQLAKVYSLLDRFRLRDVSQLAGPREPATIYPPVQDQPSAAVRMADGQYLVRIADGIDVSLSRDQLESIVREYLRLTDDRDEEVGRAA